jgi:hypothetical protein
VDLIRLRFRLLQWGAQPILLDALEDAIQADLVITEAVRIGGELRAGDWHPLGATVHRRKLSDLITWPFTGMVPTPLRDLVTARVRRGPVPAHPTLTERERTRFFDHLLAVAGANTDESTSLARRQAIYLLGFDARVSRVEWLRAQQLHALRHAKRHDRVPSWVVVRSSAVALAYGGDRDPLRTYLQHVLTTDQLEQANLTTDQLEQANLNYWAYWVGEIDCVQVDDGFMERVDPQSWSGVHLLGHLLEILRPGSGHAELNLHTRRELSDIAYAVRLAHR